MLIENIIDNILNLGHGVELLSCPILFPDTESSEQFYTRIKMKENTITYDDG